MQVFKYEGKKQKTAIKAMDNEIPAIISTSRIHAKIMIEYTIGRFALMIQVIQECNIALVQLQYQCVPCSKHQRFKWEKL